MGKLFRFLALITSLLTFFFAGWIARDFFNEKDLLKRGFQTNLLRDKNPIFKRYTIPNLAKANVQSANIELSDVIEEKQNFISYKFFMEFDPTLETGELKRVSGLINIPKDVEEIPLVVLIRGYVDQNIYRTGVGTYRAGEYFANRGFLTISPDFLGYGESSSESENIFETRFQTYTTMLSLFSAINKPSFARATKNKWDGKNIFIWAHSNGGQIALTTLVITKAEIPTTLWAPVTKPFPYSVLYYTDESNDKGKFIRSELAKLEADYDADLFAFNNYLSDINAKIQIHQGTADDAVNYVWNDTFSSQLESLNKEVNYFKHSGADHNMNPSWDEAIELDLKFFNENKK